MTTMVVSTAVSVVLAIAGLDAEALLLGLLAGGLTSLVMYQRAAPMPRPRWHRREVREMVSFGLPTALSGLAYTGTRNVDYAIVSAAFGPARTGYYYRAYLLGVDYQNKFSRILVQILFPLFSRAESIESMRLLRARVIRANAAVVFPALGVFILTAPVLVPFLLGSEWEPAVVPAQVLAARRPRRVPQRRRRGDGGRRGRPEAGHALHVRPARGLHRDDRRRDAMGPRRRVRRGRDLPLGRADRVVPRAAAPPRRARPPARRRRRAGRRRPRRAARRRLRGARGARARSGSARPSADARRRPPALVAYAARPARCCSRRCGATSCGSRRASRCPRGRGACDSRSRRKLEQAPAVP